MPKLDVINYHERDSFVTFEPKEHVYHVNGEKMKVSVTTLVHRYFHFPKDKIIEKIISSSKKNKNSEYYNLTKEQICEKWNQGALLGTRLHEMIENFYNDIENNEPYPIEFEYFLNFQKDFNFKAYRTEWIVYDKEKSLAGSIDMVYMNDDGTVSIYDWKRSKEIKKEHYYGDTALPPMHFFQNCNYNSYSLQLNIYKWILETHYNLRVKDMCLVVLHESNPNYQLEPVEDMQDFVIEIIKHIPG